MTNAPKINFSKKIPEFDFTNEINATTSNDFEKFVNELDKENNKEIVFNINTPGGNLQDYDKIKKNIDELKKTGIKIYGIVGRDAYCCSAGFLLLLNCDVKYVDEAKYLVHGVQITLNDTYSVTEMQETLNDVQEYNENIAAFLRNKMPALFKGEQIDDVIIQNDTKLTLNQVLSFVPNSFNINNFFNILNTKHMSNFFNNFFAIQSKNSERVNNILTLTPANVTDAEVVFPDINTPEEIKNGVKVELKGDFSSVTDENGNVSIQLQDFLIYVNNKGEVVEVIKKELMDAMVKFRKEYEGIITEKDNMIKELNTTHEKEINNLNQKVDDLSKKLEASMKNSVSNADAKNPVVGNGGSLQDRINIGLKGQKRMINNF